MILLLAIRQLRDVRARCLVAGLALLLLAGCVSAQPPRRLEPAPQISGLAERVVAFKGLINPFPLDRRIGTIQAGLACVGQREMRFVQTGELTRVYADRFFEEARKAGLSVTGDKGSLTAEAAVAEPQAPADLSFAGTIRDIVWNTCLYLGGPETSGEASIEVDWVVFDERKKAIVLRLATAGAGKRGQQERGGINALLDAYGDTIRRLFVEMHRAGLL